MFAFQCFQSTCIAIFTPKILVGSFPDIVTCLADTLTTWTENVNKHRDKAWQAAIPSKNIGLLLLIFLHNLFLDFCSMTTDDHDH